MEWPTVADTINAAGKGLGLYTTTVANPYSSTDANILQLVQLLSDLGQDLVRDYDWSHLQKEATFDTSDGVDYYYINVIAPSYLRFVDGTAWNRTQSQPLLGPLNAQQWQAAKGRSVSMTGPASFRVWQDRIFIYSTPSSTDHIYFEYGSSFWVHTGAAGGATDLADADAPTTKDDSLFFDKRLLVEGLKMYWKRAKGMGFEQSAFDALVAKHKGQDGAAPALSLSRDTGLKLIDVTNVPDTGYGG